MTGDSFGEVTMKKSTQSVSKALIDSEARYRRLFEAAQDGILILDATTGKIVDANPFICDLTGYALSELIDKYLWALGFIKNTVLSQEHFLQLQTTGYVRYENLPLETKRGETVFVEFISNDYWVGQTKVIQCNIRDITQRVKVEKLNAELKMMYDVILLCNHVLLHEKTTHALIAHMCQALISSGGFSAAWVSDVPEKSTDPIEPIVAEGIEKDYFDMLSREVQTKEKGIVLRAIEGRQLLICQDLQKEEKNKRIQTYHMHHGYYSVVVIPIKTENNSPSVLVVYGKENQKITEDVVTLLKGLASEITFGIDKLDAELAHLDLLKSVAQSLNQTILAMAAMVEQLDPYTAGHQRRVAELAVAIATEMGLPPEHIVGLRMASVVHDIGKIHVPVEILSKPSSLSSAEYDIVKTHAKAGWEVLKNIDFPWPVADIVYQHHERLNGSGYPQGLKDKDILLEARILMVADVVDAMAAHRPYRPALAIMAALQEVMQHKKTLFDEEVVDACVKLFLEKGYEIK
ncbi:MAG: HD domain-containing phosphohydrolase [Legionellaceae bacterium]